LISSTKFLPCSTRLVFRDGELATHFGELASGILGLNSSICSLPGCLLTSAALELKLILNLGMNLAIAFVLASGLKEPALKLAFAAGAQTL
jgi:hypothetical protein